MKTKLYLQIFCRKYFSREICSINKFRKNYEKNRKKNKTISFFLQQNFYVKIRKKIFERFLKMKCKTS